MTISCSKDLFYIHRQIWKFVGLIPPEKYRYLYFIWRFVFTVAVPFFYPLHLIIGLFNIHTKDEIFRNLAINLADLVTSIKYVVIWYNMENIFCIQAIVKSLDERVQTNQEKIHFQKIIKICKYVFYVFGGIYGSTWISAGLSTLFANDRHLMYPGWFPFDWKKSNTNYWLANIYQFIGVSLQIITTYANDTYPPVVMAVLAGHIRFLAIRISKLGTDSNKSQMENNRELIMCIKDHKKLIKSCYIVRTVLSKGMFFQLIGTGFNLCCVVISLLYYSNGLISTIYYILILMALTLQIFPSCYLGSVFEMEFSDLPYAVFSSNWMDQNEEFKQSVLILSEFGLKPTHFLCMGIFKIHLDSFYVAMKSTYSLFAVILRIK